MTINERIRTLRKQKGLNQKELGVKLGMGQAAISWIEQDGNTVTDQNILLICETFHINEKWLRTGEGERDNDDRAASFARLAKTYDLPGVHAGVIEAWLTLTDAQREALLELCDRVTEKTKAARKQQAIEQELSRYRAELEAEEKGSSASSPLTTTTATAEKRA